ncbi:TIGR01621 family pseudouridine synthase [Lacimicrobium alkaliphilum]|uniref:RNA pseudouridine synthase n=1 Tax=Lacimicrobium alkaliphilum TaxID=1526571 RepID=A0ABQ1R3P5_9ALTE|nr:TIGR01621 family pseudouridine synthase [Lacimicrobium alkaliphilum]GGD57080.1 RNA pseudouridine synthase [Lacimicrobium alkaliphilum]
MTANIYSGQGIPLVYEDQDLILVNKPVGLGMHQEGVNQSIVTLLANQCGLSKLYPVHRLDKITSGLLLLAKHKDSARELSQQFALRQIEKYYLAITDHKPAKKQGSVSGDMKKSRGGGWILTQTRQDPATTQFFSCSASAGKRLILLKPFSGKTHQIRVMLKSLGSPISGDKLYKGKEADRTYLHAFALRFNSAGKGFEFILPPSQGALFLTPGCTQAIGKYTPPWQMPWPSIGKGNRSRSNTEPLC